MERMLRCCEKLDSDKQDFLVDEEEIDVVEAVVAVVDDAWIVVEAVGGIAPVDVAAAVAAAVALIDCLLVDIVSRCYNYYFSNYCLNSTFV